MREIKEETGLNANPMLDKKIFTIQAAPVNSHIKNGKYVPSHIHYDTLFVLKVPDKDMNKIRILPTENTAVEWWPIKSILDNPQIVDWAQPVFKKVIQRLNFYEY